jgi:hypothetical protein
VDRPGDRVRSGGVGRRWRQARSSWKLVQDARKGSHDEEYEENKLLKAVEKRFGVARSSGRRPTRRRPSV